MADNQLHIRMNFLRAALCDPRLTNRQQKALTAVATYMPFEKEEGWILKTEDVAKSLYFGKPPSTNSMRETRRVIKELEDLGFIQRVYPKARKDSHSNPTFFVNWERLMEPYRTAVQTEVHTGQETPSTRGTTPLPSFSTQEYPGAGFAQERHLRLV